METLDDFIFSIQFVLSNTYMRLIIKRLSRLLINLFSIDINETLAIQCYIYIVVNIVLILLLYFVGRAVKHYKNNILEYSKPITIMVTKRNHKGSQPKAIFKPPPGMLTLKLTIARISWVFINCLLIYNYIAIYRII